MKKIVAKDQRSSRSILPLLLLVIWLVKLVLGVIDVSERRVPLYPGAVKISPYIGQMEFYVAIPAMFVALNLVFYAAANKLPKWLVASFLVLQIFALLVLLFFSTGGI